MDRDLILASAFFRAAGTGMLSVLHALVLPLRGVSAAGIGIVLSSVGFVGMGLGTALTARVGDTWGRRRSLVLFSTLSSLGALLAIFAKDLTWMSLAAFFGMFNGMGRDRGAALVLEQAAMPSIVGEGNRTRTFAWYNIVQDLGHALGSLMAGLPYLLRTMGGVPVESSYQISLGACAALFGTGIISSSLLSSRIEVPGASERPPVSPKTRRVLFRLSGLFALDSVGGGFLTTTLAFLLVFPAFRGSGGRAGDSIFSGAHRQRDFASGRRLACGANWSGQHDGLHPYSLEPTSDDGALCPKLHGRGGPLPDAGRTLTDGRTDAPVVRGVDRRAGGSHTRLGCYQSDAQPGLGCVSRYRGSTHGGSLSFHASFHRSRNQDRL